MDPTNPPRRSRTVCFRCHDRKVRCDLESRPAGEEHRPCSSCISARATCQIRPSRKGRRSQRTRPTGNTAGVASASPPPHARVAANQAHLGESSFFHFLNTNTPNADPAGTGTPRHANHGTPETRMDLAVENSISPVMHQANLEAYFEYFYPWCPILDMASPTDSVIMQHTLALLAAQARTSTTTSAASRIHYESARHLFYTALDISPIDRISACMLFHWWSVAPSNAFSMDSSFWWAGVAIRLAQSLGLHHETAHTSEVDASLRRRIWWTLYARERILGICQGRPCIIDEDFCDVQPIQCSDFPPTKSHEAKVFVHWVRLSAIVGRVNKQLFISRRDNLAMPTASSAAELITWLRSLPSALQLSLAMKRAVPLDRNVHLLYLPYLATITVMYLKNSSQVLPQASVAAVFAAGCTARIFEDFMARSSLEFMWSDAGWFIAVAILALINVVSFPDLSAHAIRAIHVLRAALKQLATTRHTAKMLDAGLENILMPYGIDAMSWSGAAEQRMLSSLARPAQVPRSLDDLCAHDAVHWLDFFPFAREESGALLAEILRQCEYALPESWFDFGFDSQVVDFWNDYNFPSSGLF